MWSLRKKPFKDGMMVAFFLLFYGIIRFIIEFFKEPDPQLGFLLGYFTMGQILCMAMIVAALLLMLYLNRKTAVRAA